MFKKKQMMTIFAFLVVLTATVLVLVGMPMYKSWSQTPTQTPTPTPSTTDQCLHTGASYHYPAEHESYPCGWKFWVYHYGFCEEDLPCHCDHQPLECVYVVFVNPITHEEAGRSLLGIQSISDTCSGDGVPETYWCVDVHVDRGKWVVDGYYWDIYFECDGGSTHIPDPSRIKTSDAVICDGFHSSPCCMELDCE